MDVTHYNSTSAAKIGREAPFSITFNIYVDEATWLDYHIFSKQIFHLIFGSSIHVVFLFFSSWNKMYRYFNNLIQIIKMIYCWWILICFLRDPLDLNDFWQYWHGKHSPSKCVSACSIPSRLLGDTIPHVVHWYFPSGILFNSSSIFLSRSSILS